MKIVLMVAAGVAVGLTVVLAVLVQVVAAFLDVLERLAPALVALAVLVLHVIRRRGGGQGRRPEQLFLPPASPAAAPSVHAVPSAAEEQPAPYLRWGPQMLGDDLDAPPVAYGPHVHRTRVGAHPRRPGRGRRP